MKGPLGAIVWLIAVLLIAFGAAGLVGAVDPVGEGDTDPALTATGDARLTPLLDAAEAELAIVATDVGALSTAARRALASLSGTDLEEVQAAVTEGDALTEDIRTRSAAVARDLATMPIVGTPTAEVELSGAVRERHARLSEAATATDGLAPAWSRLTASSLAASRLSSVLEAHVAAVATAAEHGRDADYDTALESLDAADEAIAAARELRDLLAPTVEVTTLDEWLDRSEAYDVALRDLYTALGDVGGRVTGAVREAVAAEEAARARLPPDARGMVLIMADIGRGGMNGAVIAIEEARGQLGDALDPQP
jgi:hypothetical protein